MILGSILPFILIFGECFSMKFQLKDLKKFVLVKKDQPLGLREDAMSATHELEKLLPLENTNHENEIQSDRIFQNLIDDASITRTPTDRSHDQKASFPVLTEENLTNKFMIASSSQSLPDYSNKLECVIDVPAERVDKPISQSINHASSERNAISISRFEIEFSQNSEDMINRACCKELFKMCSLPCFLTSFLIILLFILFYKF
ncbi:hypothetical protein PGT21_019207 [Puccinia graminis f. sp. tritici]|uniref:Uncharacterized protein n=1 Tax=Puccinia graminis f. sp. tritici TaxID=56615 RepID=A0A5B0LVZ5_PUCGR|nr:hypothetical protein PGTUg99_033696 [Puccinia graminis f. sp. tritici]KAA1104319.1 hypothetical protein PGT21_019207 [Puccinia graminis f. sp. tritici]